MCFRVVRARSFADAKLPEDPVQDVLVIDGIRDLGKPRESLAYLDADELGIAVAFQQPQRRSNGVACVFQRHPMSDATDGRRSLIRLEGSHGRAQRRGETLASFARARGSLDHLHVPREPIPYCGDRQLTGEIDRRDGDGAIGQTSTSGRPLVASWSAPVSFLGALYLQAPCLGRNAVYRCPCFSVDNPTVGIVATCSQPEE